MSSTKKKLLKAVQLIETKRGGKLTSSSTTRRSKKSKQNSSFAGTTTRVAAATSYGSSFTNLSAKVSGSPFSSDGSVTVSHREYLSDLVNAPISDGLFNIMFNKSINPGLQGTFPWLSTMANLFESYTVNSLTFDFESDLSTSHSGSVMVAVDYDTLDPAPPDKTTFMSFHNAVKCSPYTGCCFRFDKRSGSVLSNRHYIRAALVAGADLKTYDVGTILVAASGFAGTDTGVTVGELYVTYNITLHTPQINTSGLANAVASNLSEKIVGVSGFAPATPVGTGNTETYINSPAVVASNDGTTLIFNKVGNYIFDSAISGTGLTAVQFTNGLGAFALAQLAINYNVINSAATVAATNVIVRCTAPGQTMAITSSAATVIGFVARVAVYLSSLG